VLKRETGRDWLDAAGAGRARSTFQIKRKTETPEECGTPKQQTWPASRDETVA